MGKRMRKRGGGEMWSGGMDGLSGTFDEMR